ncbi:MAG: DUF1636 domain-containing protein [Paracoccus sp. (in: a-proteobacteria)]|uniref:DUF1636 domain-containing protein n=1 Tax=Paracoccus sp. TaxID=267 RepID=UPI0026E05FD5|nr:DUF1636 domain-containing protein [Paracoccus sp. (in: a-proteobacteria)]MDO5612477.1 DUF1636 domain-containing protein [Paracoccus sp. (in: a-proteobacteria)]MDO5631843.1 DUF1636 domain-containing protein [Paracoccus sp. (in: a-proteobacteria)]
MSGVEILVCATCKTPGFAGETRPGADLLAALADAPPPGVRVTAVDCLSNCNRGCTIALRGPGRWTYVYGDIDPARDLPDLLAGAAAYADTPDGLVPWRARPVLFRKHCIARIPPEV